MTFTIIARDRETGGLGVAIATHSVAVGGLCPFIRAGVGAVSVQASGSPELGPKALDMLAEGMEPQAVLVRLARLDAQRFSRRQICVVAADGESAVHHGRDVPSWSGHVAGDGFVAMGNSLANSEVVQAMANKYEQQQEAAFAERLISAIDAGRMAGGQRDEAGVPIPERSAALLIHGDSPAPRLDLRVDLNESAAIDELWRVYRARLKELHAFTPPEN